MFIYPDIYKYIHLCLIITTNYPPPKLINEKFCRIYNERAKERNSPLVWCDCYIIIIIIITNKLISIFFTMSTEHLNLTPFI